MPDEPKRLGMDELSFFVQMVKFTLQETEQREQNHFWWTLYRHCPNMANAIRASFNDTWSEITFSRTLRTALCSIDDSGALVQEQAAQEGEVSTHDPR